MTRLTAALTTLALAATAQAQSVTVEVQGPETARPGETVIITVVATLDAFPGGALAGFGLDLDVLAGQDLLGELSEATLNPTLTAGALAGTPSLAGIERAVGGQVPNFEDLNPQLDSSPTIDLFTAELTIDPGAQEGTVTLSVDVAENGGIVIYPDANDRQNFTVTGAGPVALTFIDKDIIVTLQSTTCAADFDNDGHVDLGDFDVLGAAFGSSQGDANFDARADFDQEGDIDLGDFGLFGVQFGRADCLP